MVRTIRMDCQNGCFGCCEVLPCWFAAVYDTYLRRPVLHIQCKPSRWSFASLVCRFFLAVFFFCAFRLLAGLSFGLPSNRTAPKYIPLNGARIAVGHNFRIEFIRFSVHVHAIHLTPCVCRSIEFQWQIYIVLCCIAETIGVVRTCCSHFALGSFLLPMREKRKKPPDAMVGRDENDQVEILPWTGQYWIDAEMGIHVTSLNNQEYQKRFVIKMLNQISEMITAIRQYAWHLFSFHRFVQLMANTSCNVIWSITAIIFVVDHID